MASTTADKVTAPWDSGGILSRSVGGSHPVYRKLLAWWQEKVSRASHDKKNTAGYDNLSSMATDILAAFVTTDRQGDAFKP